MPARISPANIRTLASLRYALRQFLHFSEAAAHRVGLTPQQHQAILAIEGVTDTDAVSVGFLAERLQIRHHSAVGLVNRLASKGLVRRKRAPNDRRKVLLVVTAKGKALLLRLSVAHREELLRIGPELIRQLKKLTA